MVIPSYADRHPNESFFFAHEEQDEFSRQGREITTQMVIDKASSMIDDATRNNPPAQAEAIHQMILSKLGSGLDWDTRKLLLGIQPNQERLRTWQAEKHKKIFIKYACVSAIFTIASLILIITTAIFSSFYLLIPAVLISVVTLIIIKKTKEAKEDYNEYNTPRT